MFYIHYGHIGNFPFNSADCFNVHSSKILILKYQYKIFKWFQIGDGHTGLSYVFNQAYNECSKPDDTQCTETPLIMQQAYSIV